MKKVYYLLMAIAIAFASCSGNGKAGKACYEIEVQFSTLSYTEMFYGDENELQAEIALLREKYKAMYFSDEEIKIYSAKLDKSKEECTATQPQEIVRTVKPTASFKMTVSGINPQGYTGGGGDGANCLGNFKFSCRYVAEGGHTSTSMMEMRLSSGLSHSYSDDSWGSNNYVHDNSYVGGRIISMSCYNATENPTVADKDFIRDYVHNYFVGYSYDWQTDQDTYYDYTPDGPFQLKKTCQWSFRNGRDSTFTVVDEVIDTYKNTDEFIEAVISHTKDNPFFQSLYYYDAGKDEFILQNRTSWNF